MLRASAALAAALAVLAVGDVPPASAPPACFGAGPAEKPADEEGVVPNDMCHVCHITFADEPLAKVHAKKKVWCRDCHGPSARHMADENIGGTKPDRVYKNNQVAPMCAKCHEKADHPTLKAEDRAARLAKSKKAQEEIKGGKIDPSGVCTDCHGAHWIPPR